MNVSKKIYLAAFILSVVAMGSFVQIVSAQSVGDTVLDYFKNDPPVTSPQDANPFNTDLVGGVATTPGLQQYASQEAGNPVLLIARLIRIALSFVGIGLVGLLVYAGYTYMTAAGQDAKVDEAKSTMKNAVVGLVVIMMALTLSTFIIQRLQVATRSYGRGGLLQNFGSAVDSGINL